MHSPDQKLWRGAFVAPCEVQRISTPYGELRTSAEKGRYIHKAVDIVDTPKNVVWAAQAGRIIVKDRFLFPGNVVVIDHGLGIMTFYSHLDDFADISVGEIVKNVNLLVKLARPVMPTDIIFTGSCACAISHHPLQWIEPGF